MRKLTAIVAALTMTFALAPASWAAGGAPFQAPQVGQVKGEVKEKCGQPLKDDLQAQLTNSQGIAVPGMTTPVARDRTFAFSNVAAGLYTIQIIGASGSSAVTVTAGKLTKTSVTVGTEKCAGLNKTTLLIVAAAAIGVTAVAVIATKNDASPSR